MLLPEDSYELLLTGLRAMPQHVCEGERGRRGGSVGGAEAAWEGQREGREGGKWQRTWISME